MKPKSTIPVCYGEYQGNSEPNQYGTTPDYALHLTDFGLLLARSAGEYTTEKTDGGSGTDVYYRVNTVHETLIRNPHDAEVFAMERMEGSRYVLDSPLRLRERKESDYR